MLAIITKLLGKINSSILEQIDDTFECEKDKMEADIASEAVGLASSADFSLINLFIRADIIVKTVIVLLIACSIYSWAIIIDKIKLFKKINIASEEFEEKFGDQNLQKHFIIIYPQMQKIL